MMNQNQANRAHMTQMAPALSIGNNFLVLTRFPGGGKGVVVRPQKPISPTPEAHVTTEPSTGSSCVVRDHPGHRHRNKWPLLNKERCHSPGHMMRK